MKLETIGSALAGWFAATGAMLVQHGTSWPALLVALIGAILAVLEMEYRQFGVGLRLFAFNAVAGIVTAPVIIAKLELTHPMALILFTFAVAYAGHDFFSSIRSALKAAAIKRLGGAEK